MVKTSRPISWTPARKNQLKRLTINRKDVRVIKESVSKLGVFRMIICRQLSKMIISCYKREKTPKYSEKQAEKAEMWIITLICHSFKQSRDCLKAIIEKIGQ